MYFEDFKVRTSHFEVELIVWLGIGCLGEWWEILEV